MNTATAEVIPLTKTCTKCGIEKPLSEFQKSFPPTTLKTRCKACDRVYHRQWTDKNRDKVRERSRKTQRQMYAKNPEKLRRILRRSRLKTMYGLTEAAYDALLIGQGNACAICRASLKGYPHRDAQVDHDHSTGKVRAILCSQCNNGLGCFRDNEAFLAEAVNYLQRHKGGSHDLTR